jgi:hypothetical protein
VQLITAFHPLKSIEMNTAMLSLYLQLLQSQCFASKVIFERVSEFNKLNWFPAGENIDALKLALRITNVLPF